MQPAVELNADFEEGHTGLARVAARLGDDVTMTAAITAGLTRRDFARSRFSGWMFHIWLWENNPGGMFTNWNQSVPLCEGSTF